MNTFFNNVQRVINEPTEVIRYLITRDYMSWIPDKLFLKIYYYTQFKKKLNLKKPKTYNEKLQWLKLNDRNPKYTKLVDKLEVRDYIGENLGEEYLIPLIGVWDTFEEIDFNLLPNQFVIKCTHDSGGVVICKNKSKFNIEKARRKINRSLSKNYYYGLKEWPYKNVKPRIICEKYMKDESEKELKDYKFMVFNGKVRCILVASNRYSVEGVNMDFYDTDWNHLPFGRMDKKRNKGVIEKPFNYDKMILFSEKLAKNIPFVRIDFYEINGKLYFGEMTFYPASGLEKFEPESYDLLLGSWLSLPNEKNSI